MSSCTNSIARVSRVGSIYDATITSADPFPLETLSDYARPGAGRAEGAGEQCDGRDLPDAAELAAGQRLPAAERGQVNRQWD